MLKEIEEEEERSEQGEPDEIDGNKMEIESEAPEVEQNGELGAASDGISTFDEFQIQKMELTKQISTALNETSLSLDFVSLLISSVKPNIGKTTMSPHLSKAVPLGSLNSDRVERTNDPGSTADTAAIGLGLKLESLSKITQLFKNAGTRLNEQVLKERVYWNNVSTVLRNNEVLYKTRDPTTGNRAIGVKYGFGDSGSSYHDKGLAVLQRDEKSGNVNFLPILSSVNGIKVADKAYKYLRVKILSKIDDDYMLTGQSTFDPASISINEEGIIGSIDKHRYFLFEEELFYYLIREAKTLINYNVSIISNKIIIEVQDNIFEIESIVYDENNEDELNNFYQNINKDSSMNNSKAQLILMFFKLMLCCFYKYNLTLRQDVPTSKTKWKLANSHPLILRPFLGYIRHDINFKNVNYILGNIIARENLSTEQYNIVSKKYLTLQPISDTKKVQDIFEKSTKSPTSEISMTIKNIKKQKHLKVDLTLSATETYCNLIVNISINVYDNDKWENGTKLLELKVSEIYDVEECLQWVISKFLNE